jgi:hypothetical protein
LSVEVIRSKLNCRLNVRVEEGRKAVRAAAALSNAPVAGQWCPATKPRKSQKDFPSLTMP